MASMFPSATRKKKKTEEEKEKKKKPDKNGLSVQLAIEFPAGFCFRHCVS